MPSSRCKYATLPAFLSLYTIHKKKKERKERNFLLFHSSAGRKRKNKRDHQAEASVTVEYMVFFSLCGFHLHHHHVDNTQNFSSFFTWNILRSLQHINFLIDILTFNNWFGFFKQRDENTFTFFHCFQRWNVFYFFSL